MTSQHTWLARQACGLLVKRTLVMPLLFILVILTLLLVLVKAQEHNQDCTVMQPVEAGLTSLHLPVEASLTSQQQPVEASLPSQQQPDGAVNITTRRMVEVVVLECEAAGTDLHVYQFIGNNTKLTLQHEHFHHSDHSLLYYTRRPHQVQQLLSPLLLKALTWTHERARVSLLVRAPTELLMMPHALRLLTNVRQVCQRWWAGVELTVTRSVQRAADLWSATHYLTGELGVPSSQLVTVMLGEQNMMVSGLVKSTSLHNGAIRDDDNEASKLTPPHADSNKDITPSTSTHSNTTDNHSRRLQQSDYYGGVLAALANEIPLNTTRINFTRENNLELNPNNGYFNETGHKVVGNDVLVGAEMNQSLNDVLLGVLTHSVNDGQSQFRFRNTSTINTLEEYQVDAPEYNSSVKIDGTATLSYRDETEKNRSSNKPKNTSEAIGSNSSGALGQEEHFEVNVREVGSSGQNKSDNKWNEREVMNSSDVSNEESSGGATGDRWTVADNWVSGTRQSEVLNLESLVRLLLGYPDNAYLNYNVTSNESHRPKRRLQKSARNENRLMNVLNNNGPTSERQMELRNLASSNDETDEVITDVRKYGTPFSAAESSKENSSGSNHLYVKYDDKYSNKVIQDCWTNRHGGMEYCKNHQSSIAGRCKNIDEAIRAVMHFLLCLMRTMEHFEICDLMAFMCREASEAHLQRLTKTIGQTLKLKWKYRASEMNTGMARENMNRTMLLPRILNLVENKKNLHRDVAKERIKREDIYEVSNVITRCMSGNEYHMYAINIPFGIFPARIMFFKERLSVSRANGVRSHSDIGRTTVSRSDVHPADTYGSRNFEHSSEHELKNEINVDVQANMKISALEKNLLLMNEPEESGVTEHDKKVYVKEDTSRLNEVTNIESSLNITEMMVHGKTELNTIVQNKTSNIETNKTLNPLEQTISEAELNYTDSNILEGTMTSNIPTAIKMYTSISDIETSLGDVNLANDAQPSKEQLEIDMEMSNLVPSADNSSKNKMQMDRQWMDETIAKLNRVVDSILRSIATGDIRVVKDGAEEQDPTKKLNEEGNKTSTMKKRKNEEEKVTPVNDKTFDQKQSGANGRLNGKLHRKRHRWKKFKRKRQRNLHSDRCVGKKCQKDKNKTSQIHEGKLRIRKVNKIQRDKEPSNTADANQTLVKADAEGDNIWVYEHQGLLNKDGISPPTRSRRSTPQRPPNTTIDISESLSLRSPCMPVGSIGHLRLDGSNVRVSGGDFTKDRVRRCRAQVRALVRRRLSLLPSIDVEAQVLLTGTFYYVAKMEALLGDKEFAFLPVEDFRKAADRVCSHNTAGVQSDPLACLDYQLTAAVLQHGLRMAPKQQMLVCNTIRGVRITAALGAALQHLDRTTSNQAENN